MTVNQTTANRPGTQVQPPANSERVVLLLVADLADNSSVPPVVFRGLGRPGSRVPQSHQGQRCVRLDNPLSLESSPRFLEASWRAVGSIKNLKPEVDSQKA